MRPYPQDQYIIANRFQPVELKASEDRYIKARLGSICLRADKVLHLRQVTPEECGALTDAPLITDGKTVWGYMDYQVKSFLKELLEGREIVWQKG